MQVSISADSLARCSVQDDTTGEMTCRHWKQTDPEGTMSALTLAAEAMREQEREREQKSVPIRNSPFPNSHSNNPQSFSYPHPLEPYRIQAPPTPLSTSSLAVPIPILNAPMMPLCPWRPLNAAPMLPSLLTHLQEKRSEMNLGTHPAFLPDNMGTHGVYQGFRGNPMNWQNGTNCFMTASTHWSRPVPHSQFSGQQGPFVGSPPPFGIPMSSSFPLAQSSLDYAVVNQATRKVSALSDVRPLSSLTLPSPRYLTSTKSPVPTPTHHHHPPPPSHPPPTHAPFKCPRSGCGRSFPTRSRLNRHLIVHSSARPFICPFAGCAKSFNRKDNMKQHAITHKESSRPIQQASDEEMSDCGSKKMKV